MQLPDVQGVHRGLGATALDVRRRHTTHDASTLKALAYANAERVVTLHAAMAARECHVPHR